jgi:hypothetical protein
VCLSRINGFTLSISDDPSLPGTIVYTDHSDHTNDPDPFLIPVIFHPVTGLPVGRYLTLSTVAPSPALNVAEVEIWGYNAGHDKHSINTNRQLITLHQ